MTGYPPNDRSDETKDLSNFALRLIRIAGKPNRDINPSHQRGNPKGYCDGQSRHLQRIFPLLFPLLRHSSRHNRRV